MSVEALVFIPIFATVLYYLGSWAMITDWLWSRYPDGFARFMACPACSGFWFGAGLGLLSRLGLGWSPWGLEGSPELEVLSVALSGLWATFWVPLLAFLHIQALSRLHPEDWDDGE